MDNTHLKRPADWVVIALCWMFIESAGAQNVTQTFTLQAGWNSIYLEVEPTDRETAAVFSNLPVASVWTPTDRLSSVDFIQNQNEANWNQSGWLVWFPSSKPEALLSSLYSVLVNRPYLIKLEGNSA